MARIVVYGATGFTGKLVVEALAASGVTDVVLGGRSAERLAALSARFGYAHRVAPVEDGRALDALCEGARVVVATAGPFVRFGEPVVRAALRAGAHYLDSTGEQPFMARVLERYDAQARERGVALVTAHGFEYALGWCAARLALDTLAERLAQQESRSRVDPAVVLPGPRNEISVEVFHRVVHFGTTRGTRKSALGAVVGEALELEAGALRPIPAMWLPRRAAVPGGGPSGFAVPIPGGEALHLAEVHRTLSRVRTHLVVPAVLALPLALLWAFRPLLSGLERLGLFGVLEHAIDGGVEGPSAESRARARFHVWAEARGGGLGEAVVVEGLDPYGLTGALLAQGARRLASEPPLETGVLSSDRALGAREVLDGVGASGTGWHRHRLA